MRIQRCLLHHKKSEHKLLFRSILLLLIIFFLYQPFFMFNGIYSNLIFEGWLFDQRSANRIGRFLLETRNTFFRWGNFIRMIRQCYIPCQSKKKIEIQLPIKEMHQTKIIKLIKFTVRIAKILKESASNY